jgi:dolichol-phosphate mannosyltransferase
VIPTYNESQNIKEMIAQVSSVLNEARPNKFEIIIVDDDSPDRTWEITQSLVSTYPYLKVIRRCGERGLATAVIRGWQAAKGDILGAMDGDLQHPPAVLPKLLIAIKNSGYAIASRHVEEGGVSDRSFMRRFVSRGARLFGLVILPGVVGQILDPLSGYFLVRRSAIFGKILRPLGYKILLEILARGEKRKVAEIGYVFQERKRGLSKINAKIYLEYLTHLLILRFSTGHAKHLDVL